MDGSIRFRFAGREDIPLILRFIKELADYEGMLDQVVATEELLDQWLFEKQKAEVLLGSCGGETVGFALFFHNFSTFLTANYIKLFSSLQTGIYLFQIKERIFIVLYIVPYIFPPFLNNGVSFCF